MNMAFVDIMVLHIQHPRDTVTGLSLEVGHFMCFVDNQFSVTLSFHSQN